MSTINITEESVFKKFSSLKTDKSPGPNNLHPKVLYEIRHEIAGYLTELSEESVETRIVPFDWKSAQITVLQKRKGGLGAKCEVSNYRPVSLTCVESKVLESICCHILCHFRLNNLFSKHQYGFIKGRSSFTTFSCAGQLDPELREWWTNRCSIYRFC